MGNIKGKISEIYQNKLVEKKILDFADLSIKTLEILESNKEVREEYQNKFLHILIDKIEDFNSVQQKIIKNLKGEKCNIFLVGNADQNIIREIKDNYWKNIILNKSYTSNQNNVENNPYFKNKSTKGFSKFEFNWNIGKIIEEIIYLNENKNIDFNEIRIIYNEKFILESLEKKLLNKNVKYKHLLGFRDFISSEEVRDIVAYIKSLIYQDDLSFIRVFKFIEGVGNKATNLIEKDCKDNGINFYSCLNNYFGNNKKKEFHKEPQGMPVESINNFINSLNYLKKISYRSGSLFNFLENVKNEFNYDNYLSTMSRYEERRKNIIRFFDILKNWEEKNHNFTSIRESAIEFLNYLDFENQESDEEKDRLILSTVYGDKKVKSKIIFFVYSDKDLIFSKLKKKNEKLEKRKSVAINRAKEVVYLINVDKANFNN